MVCNYISLILLYVIIATALSSTEVALIASGVTLFLFTSTVIITAIMLVLACRKERHTVTENIYSSEPCLPLHGNVAQVLSHDATATHDAATYDVSDMREEERNIQQ